MSLASNWAPELLRLRQTLRINWNHYNAWLFENQSQVNSIVALHALDCGKVPLREVPAILRAEYLTRVWTGTL